VKNSKGVRAKGFFTSALKMKQPQGVSNQTNSKEVKQKMSVGKALRIMTRAAWRSF